MTIVVEQRDTRHWLEATASALAIGSMPPEWVLLVAGGQLQVPAVEAIQDLGYKALVTDADPDCACASLANEFIKLDTFDIAGHVELAKERRGQLAAVFTAGADPVVTVASVAEAGGGHGLSVEIAETCANKVKTRMALLPSWSWGLIQHRPHSLPDGVSQPRFRIAVHSHELDGSISELGCDVIVKCVLSSGSRGHTRIYNGKYTGSPIKNAQDSGINPKYQLHEVLVEELLTGVELSVETLWYNGQMYPLNAVERPFKPDTCIELGHCNPAVLSPEDYQSVWNIMQQAGDAIGMGRTVGGHILKGDLILTDDGPKVLELTPRLSGGYDSARTTPLAHGANYIRGALRLALGQSLNKAMVDFMPRWKRHACCWALFSEPGKIVAIRGIEDARALGAEVYLRYNVGDTVPPLEDCTQRAGFVIAAKDTALRAGMVARAALEEIEFEVE